MAPPTEHRKKPLLKKSSLMLSVIDGSKLIENPGGRLAFERSDHVAQNDGGRVAQKKMEVVGFAIDFSDFAVNVRRPIHARFRTEYETWYRKRRESRGGRRWWLATSKLRFPISLRMAATRF